jgi:ADP-heptose:LPS heptosyltransferase
MKFLIVQLGRIGDMILMTPAFRALKEKFPDSEIYALAGRKNYKVLENNPNIEITFVHDKSPLKLTQNIYKIRKLGLDYWIDPRDHDSRESRLLAQLISANKKIGFNLPGTAVFDISLPEAERALHHVEIGLNALKPLGININGKLPRPELFPNDDSESYADFVLSENEIDDFIMLNISASNENKMWPNKKWTEFIKKSDFRGLPVLITNAPAEEERAESLRHKCDYIYRFKSRNVADVFSLAKRSKLVITPDTSVVHIAAAFNKPCFALYSGMEKYYNKFYPLSDKFEAVKADKGDEGISTIKVNKAVEKFAGFADEVL